MQNVVLDKPYRFVPPYPSEFWVRVFRYYLRHYLRRTWGIEHSECRGIDPLKESIAAGHGIILATNHPRPCDPMVLGLLGMAINRATYTMASWHLFMEGRVQRWVINRIGAFSVYREGMDREALRTATQIVTEAHRPLVMLAEGIVTRTNDRLCSLQEGLAFIGRAAAKQRAKQTPPGKVVVHPVALKYFFEGDLEKTVVPVLEWIEGRLSWRPQRQLPLVDRINKAGEALLALKEIEYMGKAQSGSIGDRLKALIDHLLLPLEKEWLNGMSDPSVVGRIKRLRTAIVPDLVTGELGEADRARRWEQLADVYLVQQLFSYPPNYIQDQPTAERILETIERFEEDLTDKARIHRPLRVIIQVGPAIDVAPTRDRSAAEDPLMKQIETELTRMLQDIVREPRPTPGG